MHPLIHAAVAAERRRDLIRQAEAHRFRAARRHRHQRDQLDMPAQQWPAPQLPVEGTPSPTGIGEAAEVDQRVSGFGQGTPLSGPYRAGTSAAGIR